MKRIAVYVATTGGPVLIQRITPERAPQSMMCLQRSSTRLSVSGAYDDFVRPGSGVIDREFGPFDYSSFRLDVSEPIDSGSDSWQLGVFAAHAIAADTEYELGDEDCDTVAWLTGRVDYDLKVGAVAHVPEKIASSIDTFQSWRKEGRRVTLFVPAGENCESAEQSDVTGSFDIVSVDTAQEVCRRLGLGKATDAVAPIRPLAVSAEKGQMPARQRNATRSSMIAVSVLLLAAAGGIGLASPETRDSATRFIGQLAGAIGQVPEKEAKPPLEAQTEASPSPSESKNLANRQTAGEARSNLQLFERRPPFGRNCADVHFGGIDAVLKPIEKDSQGAYPDSELRSLCGLSFEIAPKDPPIYTALVLKIRSGKALNGEKGVPAALKGASPLSKPVFWSIDLPMRMREPFAYELIILESTKSVEKVAVQFGTENDSDVVFRSIQKSDIMVIRIVHKVLN